MHKSLEIPGACLSLLPWCLRVSCLGQYCSAHWPRETLKILSMGGRRSIAMAGLGKQEVALNMIYSEKSPSWEVINVSYWNRKPLSLNVNSIGFSLSPSFVSLVLRHHVAGIIFSLINIFSPITPSPHPHPSRHHYQRQLNSSSIFCFSILSHSSI